jgi:hypothetical protein
MRGRAVIVLMLLLALTLVAGAPAAQAEIIYGVGKRCAGDQAVRCGYINVDTTNNRVRGYAQITDTTFRTDTYVQISSVRLYRTSNPDGGTWTEVANGGASGWAQEFDNDSTSLATCYVGHYYRVDYRWHFTQPGYSTNQVASSATVRITC